MNTQNHKLPNKKNLIQELVEKYNENALEDYQGALQQVNEYIKEQNGESEAYRLRGILYYQLQDKKQSLESLEKAVEIDPTNAKAHNGIGCIYQIEKNYPKALFHINKAIQYDQNYGGAYYNRGVVNSLMGDEEQALEDYTKAIEQDPKRKEAYFSRGNRYQELGRYDDALNDYFTALNLSPKNPLYHTNLGVLYSILKDHQKCQYHLKQAQQFVQKDQLILHQQFNIKKHNIEYIKEQINLLLKLDDYENQISEKFSRLQRKNTVSQNEIQEIKELEMQKVDALTNQINLSNQGNQAKNINVLEELIKRMNDVEQRLSHLEEKQKYQDNLDSTKIEKGITQIKQSHNQFNYYKSLCIRIITYFDACQSISSGLITGNNEASIKTRSEQILNRLNKFTKNASSAAGFVPIIGSVIQAAFEIFNTTVEYYQSTSLEKSISTIWGVITTTCVSNSERETEVKMGILTVIELELYYDHFQDKLKDPQFKFQLEKIIEIERQSQPEAENEYWKLGIYHSLVILKYIEQNGQSLVKAKTQIRDIICQAIKESNVQKQSVNKSQDQSSKQLQLSSKADQSCFCIVQ